MNAEAALIAVEVAFSPRPGVVERRVLRLPADSRVADALRQAGADVADLTLGVWGKLCEPSQLLRDGDRVELYRALQVDPKDARRLRQQRQASADAGKKPIGNRR